MAHLLRGKQAGVQRDLSSGITPEFFALDDVRQHISLVAAATDNLNHSLRVTASILRYLLSHTILFNLSWLLEPMTLNSVLA